MKPTPSFILASTSPYRRALLERIGLPHVALAPRFEESSAETIEPRDLALLFAEGKARSVASEHPSAWIIGSDQTLELDRELLRKPRGRAELLAQLGRLAGREHALHTAVVVLDATTDRIEREVTTVTLTMRPLGARELERYVELDEPFGCVGGYTFERRGVCLFERISGADDSAIVGLPLMSLLRCISALGIEPLTLLR